MRFEILVLAVLGVGSLAPASAADPAPATQPERPAAPAGSVPDSASRTTSAPTEVPAPPPASSPAPSASSTAASPPAPPKVASELSAEEQRLISLGFKPQMRNGEKIYCRREAAVGSRISTAQRCGTVAQLATMTQEGKDSVEKIHLNPKGY